VAQCDLPVMASRHIGSSRMRMRSAISGRQFALCCGHTDRHVVLVLCSMSAAGQKVSGASAALSCTIWRRISGRSYSSYARVNAALEWTCRFLSLVQRNITTYSTYWTPAYRRAEKGERTACHRGGPFLNPKHAERFHLLIADDSALIELLSRYRQLRAFPDRQSLETCGWRRLSPLFGTNV
jgi:hypothetical protein